MAWRSTTSSTSASMMSRTSKTLRASDSGGTDAGVGFEGIEDGGGVSAVHLDLPVDGDARGGAGGHGGLGGGQEGAE